MCSPRCNGGKRGQVSRNGHLEATVGEDGRHGHLEELLDGIEGDELDRERAAPTPRIIDI